MHFKSADKNDKLNLLELLLTKNYGKNLEFHTWIFYNRISAMPFL